MEAGSGRGSRCWQVPYVLESKSTIATYNQVVPPHEQKLLLNVMHRRFMIDYAEWLARGLAEEEMKLSQF